MKPERSGRWLLIGTLVAAAPLIATGFTSAASASTGQITGIGGKCVDVTDGNTTNGTQMQIWDCYSGSQNQTWTTNTDGTIQAFGKCLDVSGANTANGTVVDLWDCNTTNAQKWTSYPDGTLRVFNGTKCLDATGNTSANGTKLQIWDCFAGANQRWTIPATGGTTPPPTGGKIPGGPYLYSWATVPNIASTMSSTGIKSFSLAFILSNGSCNPQWDGNTSLTSGTLYSAAQSIKAAGGVVQVSIGGATGNKLGTSCTSASAYAAAVQKVITAVNPAVLDFDIEAGDPGNAAVEDEINNYTVQDRILNGIKTIKQNNPNVKVSVTIGTGTGGPDGSGQHLITRARDLTVPIDVYTIMPFDFYNGSKIDMYSATISAAEGLKNTLKGTFGWTDAQAYNHMGISGMNGQDDNVGNEITSTAQWTQIRDYANSKGLARLSFWAVNRDHQCSGAYNPDTNGNSCSGVTQGDFEFTRITAGF